MKIGEHEVTAVTRDSAKVGCQVVSRNDVQTLLASMNDAPYELTLRASDGSLPRRTGDVWVRTIGDKVSLMAQTFRGEAYLADITSKGIRRYGYIGNESGLTVETSLGGQPTAIKLLD